jgi:hypothetical protein
MNATELSHIVCDAVDRVAGKDKGGGSAVDQHSCVSQADWRLTLFHRHHPHAAYACSYEGKRG